MTTEYEPNQLTPVGKIVLDKCMEELLKRFSKELIYAASGHRPPRSEVTSSISSVEVC